MNREEEQKDISSNREIAAFSYFLIFSPLLLYTKKGSPFIQFHARQAAFLFVGGVLFAILGKPFSYANFLILALCITGIIQANMGNKWRAPIVADIIESGISMTTVKNIFGHYSKILRQMFAKTEKDESTGTRIEAVQDPSDITEIKKLLKDQKEKIYALNEKLLIHAVLRGKEKSELSPSGQEKTDVFLKKIEQRFPKSKKTELKTYVRYDFSHFSVFAGAYSEESICVCFWGERLKTEFDTIVHFGNTKEEDRIISAIQKLQD